MSEMSTRRDLFKVIGGSMVVGNPALAQHVHAVLAEAKSLSGGAGYQPKCFTQHNFVTLKKLADLIIPGANDAGAAEYIDLLSSHNPELAAIFNGGFGWLDDYMGKQYGADFLTAKAEHQTALLDHLSSGKTEFWVWTRNMVVDAYYTSPVGVQDLGYMGNTVVSHFSVPQEAVDYVMKRSPI
jgi:hypothetical protein